MKLTNAEYDRRDDRLNRALKPMLTDEFLDALVKAARVIGGTVDYVEVAQFVTECFDLAGKEPPTADELDPYMYKYL